MRPTRAGCPRFQSHAGSIEATTTAAAIGIHLRSFNPTLVRLRPDHPVEATPDHLPFQSHAGSIEAVAMIAIAGQSVKVSIPRWFD